MKKNRILVLAIASIFCSCKSKKLITFEEKYKAADSFYEKKKFDKAAEIYEDIYLEVPNKIDSINILKKLADCLYQEKNFKRCFNDYKKLYEVVNDDDKLIYGFRMCNCFYNIVEKNNKRDISKSESLLEMIDEILDNYSNTSDEQKMDILKNLQKIKNDISEKIIEKEFNVIRTYERLEMFDAAVVYSKNFIAKYPDSHFFDDVCYSLLKNEFLSATNFETKNKKVMNAGNKNILFEKWKNIILTFNSYKDHLQDYKDSEELYNQALRKINL